MALPLMQKATAVWLIDNTKLTFAQIAKFCGLHELEVNGIADGEVATGIRGMDPISNNQLTLEEIQRCENDQSADLVLLHSQLPSLVPLVPCGQSVDGLLGLLPNLFLLLS